VKEKSSVCCPLIVLVVYGIRRCLKSGWFTVNLYLNAVNRRSAVVVSVMFIYKP